MKLAIVIKDKVPLHLLFSACLLDPVCGKIYLQVCRLLKRMNVLKGLREMHHTLKELP